QSQPGQGSTFEVIFCLERVDDKATLHVASGAANPDPAVEAGGLAGKKILVVDDSGDNLTLVDMYLRPLGAELILVDSGYKAMEEVRQTDFDLVLMDIQMPDMDGEETAAKIREMGFKMPIVALTAHAMRADQDHYRAAGINQVLTKPIKQTVLVSAA